MASITFVDESTVIPASWLNDVDAWLYEGIPGAAFTALDISGAAQGQIKFPATKNASAGANTLDDYQESSYTGTATGMTTSPTVTVYYTIVGNMVVMETVGDLSGTSNATTFTCTGMPAEARPVQAKVVFVRTIDNGGTITTAVAQIETSGVITLFSTVAGGAFTGSGTKTWKAGSFAYTLI